MINLNEVADEIYSLNQSIKTQKATSGDKVKYMSLLSENGIITPKQLENFQKGKDSDYILNHAVTLGGLFILGSLIDRIGNVSTSTGNLPTETIQVDTITITETLNDSTEELALQRPNGDVYATINYEKDNGLIYLDWHGFLTKDLVIEGSERLLDLIELTNCGRILVDNRKVSGPWQAANEWYQYDWNPRAAKAGLTHMAIVMSENIFSQLSLQGFAKVTEGVYMTNIFNNEVAARQWLKSYVYHQITSD